MGAFSYKHSPYTPAQYQELLDRLGKMFFKWRLGNVFYQSKPLEQAFKLWWFSKGPTGFCSADDRLRFKRELFSNILTMTAPNETPDLHDTDQP